MDTGHTMGILHSDSPQPLYIYPTSGVSAHVMPPEESAFSYTYILGPPSFIAEERINMIPE